MFVEKKAMEELFDILKYLLPSLVVFAAAYYVMKLFIENEGRNRMKEYKTENTRLITPLRLQAYERIILLLERITPSNLIMRVYRRDITSAEFQVTLLQSIRDEYEHNLSQQIYVSEASWELTKNAKEEIIKIINTAATSVPDGASSADLSQVIIEKTLELKEMPTHKAIAFIKKEIQKAF